MKPRSALLFLAASALCGCPGAPINALIGAHVDGVRYFSITGDVVDATSGQPVEGATVTFVDTGLTGQPAVSWEEEVVGESNVNGHIRVRFAQWWGATITLEDILTGGLAMTFDLVVSKEGYESQEFHFVGSTCTTTENVNVHPLLATTYIDLNTVRLEPVSERRSLLEVGRKAVAQLFLIQMLLP
ncbi:MAG TPA: hypothetical protein HPP77_10815 [Candidatus Hydrogenedentes bacterium]|nr:hypothetical protein [Candidatus Hydrogenedentota bacterium]